MQVSGPGRPALNPDFVCGDSKEHQNDLKPKPNITNMQVPNQIPQQAVVHKQLGNNIGYSPGFHDREEEGYRFGGCHGSEAMNERPDTGMRLTSDKDMAHGHFEELPCSVSLNALGSSSEGPKWPKGLWGHIWLSLAQK